MNLITRINQYITKVTKNKTIFVILSLIFTLSFYSVALAGTSIHLEIETNTGNIYKNDIDVSPCDSDGDISTPDTITAYCALMQSGITSEWSGLWVNSINGLINNDNNNGVYWMWLANLNTDNTNPDSSYNLSAKQYILNTNDRILFYYNTNPLDISVDNDKPEVGQNIKITVKELGLDSSWNPIWNKASQGKVLIDSNLYDLDEEGSYSFTVLDTSIFRIKGQKTNYIDTKEITISPTAPVEVIPPVVVVNTGNVGGGPSYTPPPVVKVKFDLNKAFKFIISQQKENGSFGEDLYTDWTAIAISSSEDKDIKINSIIKLAKYLTEYKASKISLTDVERHAMALMALGLNPYNTNGENYIERITSEFDGKQFGNVGQDNDDIFALIVLQNAGFTETDKMITDDITFILESQRENGSWDESVDMTSAAIQALSHFSPIPGIGESLQKAKEFLKLNQKDTGGWDNVSSTAWAIGGILALNEKIEDWKKNEKSPLDYIDSMQDIDGGIKNTSMQEEENLTTKIWQTVYAVSALSGKTWSQIMQKFEKIEEKKEQILNDAKETLIEKTKEIKEQILKDAPKTSIKKIPTIPKKAAVMETITVETPTPTKTETPKKNWFIRILNNIFNIF